VLAAANSHHRARRSISPAAASAIAAAEIIAALHATGLANIVALCDVDMGAPHTQKILKKFPNAPRFQDFRKMFDKLGKEIEAVCVGTPDFSHFPIAMLAMSLGKHVYVEKPLAHTLPTD
jgi:predicted dehydrogenase